METVLFFRGHSLNFNGVLPGNEMVIFLAFFCNIKCKFYRNYLHTHAPSIKYTFSRIFHEILFSCNKKNETKILLKIQITAIFFYQFV